MRKYSLLLLFCGLFSIVWAQENKTLTDESTPIGFYAVDKQIDIGFTPTSNFIQSYVFWSFKLKNRQDYKEVIYTGALEYYVQVDSITYHETKAADGDPSDDKRYIDNTSGKKYFIDVDSAAYAQAQKDNKTTISKKGTKAKFIESSKSPYVVTTALSDGTTFTISYKDQNSCLVNYSDKDKSGGSYEVSQVMEFGKEYEITKLKSGAKHKFKVDVAANASLSAEALPTLFVADKIAMPIVLLVLLLGALFFTIYFKFPNITRLKLAFDTVRGKYYDPKGGNVEKDEDNPDTIRDESVEGEVSPFQALSAALSATVGLGNIAGVAIAITIGGPGATFWMIVAGLLGMASKFAECTLGVKYREIGPDGTVHGGPMYYLSKGLKEKGFGFLGKIFAVFFAIMCVGGSFGGGNMFQANQAAVQVLDVFGIQSGIGGFIFGLITAILVAIVIIGGIKRIGKVAETIVPFMAILYVGAALIVIFVNITAIPTAFGEIFSGAFSPAAATGGFVGVLIAGFQRAAFSNEAGVGSAAIAHSAVRTTHPASEGVVALLEPFIDTVVICTMSALVIIVTGNHLNDSGLDGVGLTSEAFSTVIPGFQYILTVAVVLFAFSTMLSWSYYGLQAWKYLFGKGKTADLLYKVLFCVFVVVGSSASLGAVIGFSDAMIFAMVFPNIIGLIILAPVVRKEVKRYVDDIRSGKIKAVK